MVMERASLMQQVSLRVGSILLETMEATTTPGLIVVFGGSSRPKELSIMKKWQARAASGLRA
jgi:hypothetical protein